MNVEENDSEQKELDDKKYDDDDDDDDVIFEVEPNSELFSKIWVFMFFLNVLFFSSNRP